MIKNTLIPALMLGFLASTWLSSVPVAQAAGVDDQTTVDGETPNAGDSADDDDPGHSGSGSNQSGDGSGNTNIPTNPEPENPAQPEEPKPSEPTPDPTTPDLSQPGNSDQPGSTGDSTPGSSAGNDASQGSRPAGNPSGSTVTPIYPAAPSQPSDDTTADDQAPADSHPDESTPSQPNPSTTAPSAGVEAESESPNLGGLVWIFLLVAVGVVALAAGAAFLIQKFAGQTDASDQPVITPAKPSKSQPKKLV